MLEGTETWGFQNGLPTRHACQVSVSNFMCWALQRSHMEGGEVLWWMVKSHWGQCGKCYIEVNVALQWKVNHFVWVKGCHFAWMKGTIEEMLTHWENVNKLSLTSMGGFWLASVLIAVSCLQTNFLAWSNFSSTALFLRPGQVMLRFISFFWCETLCHSCSLSAAGVLLESSVSFIVILCHSSSMFSSGFLLRLLMSTVAVAESGFPLLPSSTAWFSSGWGCWEILVGWLSASDPDMKSSLLLSLGFLATCVVLVSVGVISRASVVLVFSGVPLFWHFPSLKHWSSVTMCLGCVFPFAIFQGQASKKFSQRTSFMKNPHFTKHSLVKKGIFWVLVDCFMKLFMNCSWQTLAPCTGAPSAQELPAALFGPPACERSHKVPKIWDIASFCHFSSQTWGFFRWFWRQISCCFLQMVLKKNWCCLLVCKSIDCSVQFQMEMLVCQTVWVNLQHLLTSSVTMVLLNMFSAMLSKSPSFFLSTNFWNSSNDTQTSEVVWRSPIPRAFLPAQSGCITCILLDHKNRSVTSKTWKMVEMWMTHLSFGGVVGQRSFFCTSLAMSSVSAVFVVENQPSVNNGHLECC